MEKTIIYRNEKEISDRLAGYRKAIAPIQSVIDELADEGLSLTDGILNDLSACNGNGLRASMKADIDREVSKFQLRKMRDSRRKELESLLPLVDESVERIRKAMQVPRAVEGDISLNIEHFTCKGLKIGLVEDLEQTITDQYTLYEGENPEIDEAYRRALKIQEEIHGFEEWLRTKGDILHPITKEGLYGSGYIPGLLSVDAIEGKYCLKINRSSFGSIRRKKPSI